MFFLPVGVWSFDLNYAFLNAIESSLNQLDKRGKSFSRVLIDLIVFLESF